MLQTLSSFFLPRHVFTCPSVKALCESALRLLLCLSCDESLVAPGPEEAQCSSTLPTLLSQLAQVPSVEVVVVSSRTLADLCTYLPVPGITYVGTHGLEIRTATGEKRVRMSAGAFTAVMARLRRDLETIISGRSGFLLEAKPHALALHYHSAGKEDRQQAVAQLVAAVQGYQCRGVPLEAHRGKRVVEVRLVGVTKGQVVRSLLGDRDNTVLPLYLGDDPTDEGAFQALNGCGLSILVADPPRRTAARYYLKDSAEVLSFLSHVLRLRQKLIPRS